MAEGCELCRLDQVLFEAEQAYVRYDNNALSRGHVLVVPRRHVADFFEMIAAEKASVIELLDKAKAFIAAEHKPDGYNIGVNSDAPAASRACMFTSTSSRAIQATWPTQAAASAVCWPIARHRRTSAAFAAADKG